MAVACMILKMTHLKQLVLNNKENELSNQQTLLLRVQLEGTGSTATVNKMFEQGAICEVGVGGGHL